MQSPISSAPPAPVARQTRHVALITTLALIALGLAWELLLAPTGARSLALKVIPLALGVAGLAKYRMGTYRWMSLLVWLYVLEGALRATSDVGLSAQLGWLELALALTLFAACAMHVRTRLAHAKPAAEPSATPSP